MLQKTFPADELKKRIRRLARGDKADPLDLVEWLEEQGYEPEAQVTRKGEIAMRGGIVDIFPPTSPWPARLEFFGDELESLREFDPATQMSRAEITEIVIPPAGELGILKRMLKAAGEAGNETRLVTLVDHLPPPAMIVLCEPELLAARADEYARQVPDGDVFSTDWAGFQGEAGKRQMSLVELSEGDNVRLHRGRHAEGNESGDREGAPAACARSGQPLHEGKVHGPHSSN